MLHPVFIIIFVQQTLSWCQRVVRISRNRENLTVIELTHNNNNNDNRSDTLSWCQISGKNSRNRRENLTVIKLMHNNNNNASKFKEEFIAFQEAFQEDFVNIQTSSETISYNHNILEM